ncbi:hypothetical protein [Amycolatopsis anabasis]|uniref:hypothetical protein n=1 Tax=Amycolatopsis anabasis TaxID=1840409 RepID=UPI0015D2C764|nr:hypothetical protein [Amycolatopsis anabasis]
MGHEFSSHREAELGATPEQGVGRDRVLHEDRGGHAGRLRVPDALPARVAEAQRRGRARRRRHGQTAERAAVGRSAGVLPGARHHTLDGQTHIVEPAALAPVLVDFFAH